MPANIALLRIIIIYCFLHSIFSCTSQHKDLGISFIDNHIDIGVVKVKEPKIVEFRYNNLSDSILIINQVITGCNCTIATWDTLGIRKGEEAKITVVFVSEVKTGVNEVLTVYFNRNESPIRLYLTGQVQ